MADADYETEKFVRGTALPVSTFNIFDSISYTLLCYDTFLPTAFRSMWEGNVFIDLCLSTG